MLEQLKKLLNVKSIISIMLCTVFCILAIKGNITEEQFVTIFTMVISFFFGYQLNK